MNTRAHGIRWLLLALLAVLLVAVLSQVNFFSSGKTVYHVSSIASSTIYYIKLQVARFQSLNFYPQYWSNRIYTSGPIHTGLGVYNPLLLTLVFFRSFGHALLCYDILLKVIAGLGLYLLLRKYGFSGLSALCCASLYPLNPYVSAFGSDPQFVGIVCWMPFVILSLELLVEHVREDYTQGLAYAVMCAATLAFTYLSSNIQSFTFFVSFVVAPYILLRSNAVRFGSGQAAYRLFIFAGIAGILACLLIGFELVPTITVLATGNRSIAADSYSRIALYALLLVFIAQVVRGLHCSKFKIISRVALVLIAVSFIFSEGSGSLYNVLIANYRSSPQETHFVFNEYFIRHLTALQLVLLLIVVFKPRFPRGSAAIFYLAAAYFVLNFIPRQGYAGLSRHFYAFFPEEYIRYSFVPLAGVMVGMAGALDTLFDHTKRLRMPLVAFALVAVLIAENYFVFIKRTLFTSGFAYLEKQCPEYDFLKGRTPLERVEAVYNDDHALWKKSFSPSVLPKWLMPSYFGANTFSRVGIGVIPKNNAQYFNAALPLYFGLDEKSPVNPLLSLAGVKYIFSFNRLTNTQGLRFIRQGDEYSIYENTRVLPRVFLVPSVKQLARVDILPAMREAGEKDFLHRAYTDSTDDLRLVNTGKNDVKLMNEGTFSSNLGSVSVARYDNEAVEIRCRISERCMLIFTDTFFPGWKAFIDGAQQKLIRVDHIYRGLAVSPGAYTVIMKYDAEANRYALWVSALAAAAGILYVGAFFLTHKGSHAGRAGA